MNTNVTCPSCHHKYWIQEGDMGSRQICPSCQTPFFAGASVASGKAAVPPVPASAGAPASYARTMLTDDAAPPIKYNCPRCKTPLEAQAIEAGTKKNCPSCTQRHQVPQAKVGAVVAGAPNLNKTMLTDDAAAAPLPPIKYNCPGCKRPLESPAAEGGTKKNCPYCSQRLQIPAAPNRNKTMLATEGGGAVVGAAAGAGVAVGASAGAAGAAGVAPPVNPWQAAMTPKNVLIGVLILLLLLYVVPAFIRGGKSVDTEAEARQKMELEKMKAEIAAKQKEMEQQRKDQLEAQRRLEEDRRARDAENQRRQEFMAQLQSIKDDELRAQKKKEFLQEQQRREEETRRKEAEHQRELEKIREQLTQTEKSLKDSQNKQTTIQQAPAPVIYYPPYNPYYYRPWWW